MSYNFFNTSNLAFGNKLTRAFLNLNKEASDAEDSCKLFLDRWEYYQGLMNKNYKVPRPADPDSPCRTDELYSLLSNKPIMIKQMKFVDNKLKVTLLKFNVNTDRITKLTGETELKEGYIFIQEAISNQNPNREIQFVKDPINGVGEQLCQYRVDTDGVVNLIDDVSPLRLIPFDFTQYTSISYTETLKSYSIQEDYKRFDGKSEYYGTSSSFTYKVPEDMCIMAIGSQAGLRIRKNGEIFSRYGGYEQGHFVCFYAKKGDTYIFDNCIKILRIKYTQPSAT